MKPSMPQIVAVALGLASTALVSHADPIVFSNGGPIDPSNPYWSAASPDFTIFDEFVLTTRTMVTGLSYSIFTEQGAYIDTQISVRNGTGPTSTVQVPLFTAVGVAVENGLTNPPHAVSTGYDIGITGLAIILNPGTYYLGLGTTTHSGVASIGSSDSGHGLGLVQKYKSNTWDQLPHHMVFSVSGHEVADGGSRTIGLVTISLFTLFMRRKPACEHPGAQRTSG